MYNLIKTYYKSHQDIKSILKKMIEPSIQACAHKNLIPSVEFTKIKQSGILGALVPKSYLGKEQDYIYYGLLNAEMGKLSPALRAMITVHDMVAMAINEFGSEYQKEKWLPSLATGQLFSVYGLSEDKAGSNINQIKTRLEKTESGYTLIGQKKWISFASYADLILVFAKFQNEPVALLIPFARSGIQVEDSNLCISERWATVNTIHFDNVKVTDQDIIGEIGTGFSVVANQTLTQGRISIAWSNLGIMQGCYQSCRQHALKREVGDSILFNSELTQRKLTEMIVDIKASNLLCLHASEKMNHSISSALADVMVAKYKTAKTAVRIANETVQMHGAKAFQPDNMCMKWLAEAKLTEIIEGSREIHEKCISQLYDDELW